jgi:hypothetical protein
VFHDIEPCSANLLLPDSDDDGMRPHLLEREASDERKGDPLILARKRTRWPPGFEVN